MKNLIFTTSWDDGGRDNLKLLDLLNKYGLKGTFYIQGQEASDNAGRHDLLEIVKTQEVGGHTLNHPKLTKISLQEAKQEIISGKGTLESLLGQKVEMFAYPYGMFNEEIKNIVFAAGFLGARTVKKFDFNLPKDFFEFNTTFQVYPHPFRKRDAKHLHGPKVVLQPLKNNFSPILKLKLPLNSFLTWPFLVKNLFDYSHKNGEIFHLFGHAHEIEKYGLWQDLEKFFKYLTKSEGIIYLTNSEVLKQTTNVQTKLPKEN
ncbi:MAG: polysaccharide deacetylase family protein [Patescibacteria group bacterium]